MNAAEQKAIRHLVHHLGAKGWACVKFYDGEAMQRGVNPHAMTQEEAVKAVESVDDGLLYFRRVDSEGVVRYGTVRTIPDNCRDGIEVINDWSLGHTFHRAMDSVVDSWEADRATASDR